MTLRFERVSAICVIAVMLTLCVEAFAQANRSTISGFVFDPDRRPVGQVIVELASDFSTVGRTRTDGSGRFFFAGLPHGRYSIKVLPLGTGMMEQTEEVEIAGIGVRGQAVTDNVQKDIYLKLRKGANSVPFQNAVIYAQEVPKEAEDLYKNAVADLDDKRAQAGIEGLEKAVAAFPTYFMALQKLGIVRLTQERYEDASELFKRALAINDRCFDCWYGLGYADYSLKKYPESVSATEKAIAIKTDSIEGNILLGMSRRMTKDFPKAEQAFKQATKIADGTSPDAHWNLALLYGKDMNRFADAAKELELYLKAAPDAPNKEDIKKLIKQFKDKAKGAS